MHEPRKRQRMTTVTRVSGSSKTRGRARRTLIAESRAFTASHVPPRLHEPTQDQPRTTRCRRLAACESPTTTAPRKAADEAATFKSDRGIIAATSGDGRAELPPGFGLVAFSFGANEHFANGGLGTFRQSRTRNGLTSDFAARVTCVTVDAVHNRAWVGGVVTENNSTDPNFRQAIHEVGRDVWFRVVDNGEGGNTVPDRMTVLGFTGAAILSPRRSTARPWLAATRTRSWLTATSRCISSPSHLFAGECRVLLHRRARSVGDSASAYTGRHATSTRSRHDGQSAIPPVRRRRMLHCRRLVSAPRCAATAHARAEQLRDDGRRVVSNADHVAPNRLCHGRHVDRACRGASRQLRGLRRCASARRPT